jgi:hypothetical protein
VIARTAAEAERLAVALTTTSLPPAVQVWLTATEHHNLVVASVGGHPPALPSLTAEERDLLSHQVKSLSEILRPARDRGPELEIEVAKLFAAFNVYTGDEGKLKAQVLVWCEELEEFPLFAIRKAAKWSVRGCQKLPSLAAFIADVRLAIGSGVLERARLLEFLSKS